MITLTEKFVRVCLDFSEREAMRIKVSSGWSVYRYRDLLLNARKLAAWLGAQGFKKEEKAAIIFDNSPQWCMTYFGVLLAGGVCVPLDPQSSRQDMVTFIEDAGASFVFMENRLLEILQHHLRQAKRIVVFKKEKGAQHCISLDEIFAATKSLENFQASSAEEEDTASLIYSSGTTANPKGVELSHRNLYSNFESINQLKVCSAGDCFVSILPLFHSFSFMATLLYPLFLGARIVYPRTIKSTELAEIIRETGITIMVGVPELFSNIHKSIIEKINEFSLSKRIFLSVITQFCWHLRKSTGLNLNKLIYKSVHEKLGDKLRYLISGGARLDYRVAVDFEKFGFTILEGYGLTETAPVVTFNPPKKPKPGSVGKPLPGVSVRIENPDAEGIGEIVISGPNVMKGYYQKSEETEKILKDGWFYSGDLGRFDAEGYLSISGRLKEVIVLGSGKNIFPDEVEKYYSQSKYIREVGVFLSGQDGAGALKAVIVPNFEIFKKSGQINIEEKIRWDVENISKELAAYKRVMGFAVSKEELPKTRLGKIKRYQLPQIYMRESIAAFPEKTVEGVSKKSAALASPIGERLVQFLKKELSLDKAIEGDDHLELDLGIDSLARVELIAGIEKLFRIRLPDDVLHDVGTVEDLVKKIDQLLRRYVSTHETEEAEKDFAVDSWREILNVDAKDKQFEKINLNPPRSRRATGYVVKAFIFLVLKIFCRFKVTGSKNLPRKGPYIICPNHTSFLDAFAVIAGLPFDVAFQTYFIGLKDIFDLQAFRWSVKFAQVIPIDPTMELVRAMQAASVVLKNNKILCIFPEGQRSIDGETKRFKNGIGILAAELGIQIVPVCIEGAHKAWPRTSRFPKPHPVTIAFGKPVDYGKLVEQKGKSKDDLYKRITEKIREDVLSLQAAARKKD